MAATQGILRAHQAHQVLTFQVEGEATMFHSVPLCRCAEQALAGEVTTLRVDLRHCTYMDSTFLGTLLLLKRTIEQRGRGDFALTALSPQCQRLLHQMGLDRFYCILAGEELPASAWTELTAGPSQGSGFQHTVIQAHQELANVPGPAGQPFRDVMRCLTQDLERQRTGQPADERRR
jgi:anti-anti-sigma factor